MNDVTRTSNEKVEAAFNRAVARLGELFAYKQQIREVGGQQAGLERYKVIFSGQTFSEVNELLHDLGVAIRQYSGHEPPAEQLPSAWIKGHTMHTDSGIEYDEEVVPGSDRPKGDGWHPLYSRPSQPPRRASWLSDHERACYDICTDFTKDEVLKKPMSIQRAWVLGYALHSPSTKGANAP